MDDKLDLTSSELDEILSLFVGQFTGVLAADGEDEVTALQLALRGTIGEYL